MTKSQNISISLVLAAAFYTPLFATDLSIETTTQSNSIDIKSAPIQSTNDSVVSKSVAKVSEPVRASFAKEENTGRHGTRHTKDVSIQAEQVAPAFPSTTTAKMAKRSENFTIISGSKEIAYTLPQSLENAQIEFYSLDGKYTSHKNHGSHDIGGAFDTTSLESGRYIIRLVDENGKKTLLTRAITINK